jgi:hypothetical protein
MIAERCRARSNRQFFAAKFKLDKKFHMGEGRLRKILLAALGGDG